MTRSTLVPGEKPLIWVGSSLKDLRTFPGHVRDAIGDALSTAQFGSKHKTAKPWKGDGPGVLEILEDHRGDTFRAVYTLRFEHALYVLHAFQKKSKAGIATPLREQQMIARRLKDVQQHYEESYGKA